MVSSGIRGVSLEPCSCKGVLRKFASIHLGTACFFGTATKAILPFQSSEAPFFGAPRLDFGCEARCFF